MRITAFSKFSSTGYKCQTLAEFDLPTVTDEHGDVFTALSSNTSTTPDGDPILYVAGPDGSAGYIFVETIRLIEGE